MATVVPVIVTDVSPVRLAVSPEAVRSIPAVIWILPAVAPMLILPVALVSVMPEESMVIEFWFWSVRAIWVPLSSTKILFPFGVTIVILLLPSSKRIFILLLDTKPFISFALVVACGAGRALL